MVGGKSIFRKLHFWRQTLKAQREWPLQLANLESACSCRVQRSLRLPSGCPSFELDALYVDITAADGQYMLANTAERRQTIPAYHATAGGRHGIS